MTVLSSEGLVGFGGQTAKGTEATTWYRHAVARAALGPQQIVQQFPPEVEGGFHPTGAYKQMVLAGGQAVMYPRLENVLGWLLYATAGKLSTTADTPEVGMHRHTFTPPDSAKDMKWLSLRRYIPGAAANQEIGEIMLDCRASAMRLVAAPGQVLNSTFTFVGREPDLIEEIDAGDANAWVWNNAIEDYTSVPLAHQGSLKVPASGGEQKATGLTIDIINAYTPPQRELIIGSPYPDDFALLSQSMVVSWVYKWQDATLYKHILTSGQVAGGDGHIDWSPIVYTSNLEFIATSAADVSGLSNPYRLRVTAPSLTWQSDGPPELMGGGWLALRFVGTAQRQTDPNDYFKIELDNESAGYTWPS